MKITDICFKTSMVVLTAVMVALGIRIVICLLSTETYPYLLEIKLK
jgi:hypothetical protein